MSRKLIPFNDAFRNQANDPAFNAANDAVEGGFAIAGALIKARDAAGMTQEEVAKAMGTTQAVVTRLESGRAKPSTRTLVR